MPWGRWHKVFKLQYLSIKLPPNAWMTVHEKCSTYHKKIEILHLSLQSNLTTQCKWINKKKYDGQIVSEVELFPSSTFKNKKEKFLCKKLTVSVNFSLSSVTWCCYRRKLKQLKVIHFFISIFNLNSKKVLLLQTPIAKNIIVCARIITSL